jgi:hypothetical protein
MQGTIPASSLRHAGARATHWASRVSRHVLLAALLTVVAGCTTVPDRKAAPAFRVGAATANQQSQAALAEANRFLRQQQIERVAGKPDIEEKDFADPLDDRDVAKWNQAFALIDDYAAALEKLLDPARRTEAEDALGKLVFKIGDIREEQLPTRAAVGFTQLAGLLTQYKAGKDALAAIRKADPSVQEIFSTMAAAIGDKATSGVRDTVTSSWTIVLARLRLDFRSAQGLPAKRDAAARYVAALDQRDAQDASLASLRRSFLLLATAHRELAAGRMPSAQNLLDEVQQEYEAYRKRVDSLKDEKGAAP